MSRTYEVSLQINAALGGQFSSLMRQAQTQINRLGDEAQRTSARTSRSFRELEQYRNNLNRLQGQVFQYRNLNSQIAENSQRNIQARQNQRQLLEVYNQEQAQLERLRQSLERLRQARRENRSAMSADQYRLMGEQIRAARGEIQSQQQAVTLARRNYNNANSELNRLNSSLRSQQNQLQSLSSSLNQAGISTSNLSRHESNLRSEIENTNTALQRQVQASSARERMNNASTNVSYAYGNFQGAVDTASSILSPITSSVEVYANFDATMSQVKAVTGVTGESFDALKAKARELGKTTQFSASEAASAMVMLGKTGWNDAQILGGIKPLLQTAIAGGADLATTADIVSDTMSAFGKVAGKNMTTSIGTQMESTQRFADVFAATASGANTDINLMGETFKYAAATAGSLGYSIEDVALATGIMGNNAVKGSMAGTALNSIMTRMVAPPADAAKSLSELGISAKNADGTLKPFRQQIQELRSKFKGLTEAEKAEHAQKIAGTEAMKGFLALMNESDASFDSLTSKIDNSAGATDRMAGTMADNFEGSMKSLESVSESVKISLGSIFEPAARSAANFLTSSAQGLETFIQQHQTAVQWAGLLAAGLAGIIVAAAGVQLAFATWGFITGAITLASTAVSAFSGRILAFTAVQRIAQGATMAFTAAQGLLNAVMMMNPVGLVVAGVVALIAVIGGIIALCPSVSSALSEAWNSPKGAIQGFADLAKSLAADAVNYVINCWETLKSALSNPIDAVINFMDHGSVVGGNVQGGGNISAPAQAAPTQAPIDTSNAQNQVNQLGDASSQAANATNNFASSVETNSNAAQNLNQNITAIGEGANLLQQNLSAVGTEFTNVQTGTQGAAMELTNLQTNLSMTSPPITQLGMESQNSASGVQSLAQAASQAAGSLSQIEGAAGQVAGALSSKAAEISSIHISVPTVSAAPVAANAKGGIYDKGAFLTTFAEDSPEAAIPLDGSQRAKNLWTQAGQMLGMLPGNSSESFSAPESFTFSDKIKLPEKNSDKNISSIKNFSTENYSTENFSDKNYSTEKISGNNFLADALKFFQGQGEENSAPEMPINISISVTGSADEKVMQQAGNEIAFNLKRELDSWWREKNHDAQRRSFE